MGLFTNHFGEIYLPFQRFFIKNHGPQNIVSLLLAVYPTENEYFLNFALIFLLQIFFIFIKGSQLSKLFLCHVLHIKLTYLLKSYKYHACTSKCFVIFVSFFLFKIMIDEVNRKQTRMNLVILVIPPFKIVPIIKVKSTMIFLLLIYISTLDRNLFLL